MSLETNFFLRMALEYLEITYGQIYEVEFAHTDVLFAVRSLLTTLYGDGEDSVGPGAGGVHVGRPHYSYWQEITANVLGIVRSGFNFTKISTLRTSFKSDFISKRIKTCNKILLLNSKTTFFYLGSFSELLVYLLK